MTTEEMRSKWEKILESMPFNQDFEFDMNMSEAAIVLELLSERDDTIYSVESLSHTYVN